MKCYSTRLLSLSVSLSLPPPPPPPIVICCHSSGTLWTLLSASCLNYHAHNSPQLTYASTVWGGCGDILFNKLKSLHRRDEKVMISDSSLTTDTKLRYLGLLPLKEKLMFNNAVLVFKAHRNLAPRYLKQLFICCNTRAISRFITLPKPRIDLFKTSFSFSGASLWNAIPTQIK